MNLTPRNASIAAVVIMVLTWAAAVAGATWFLDDRIDSKIDRAVGPMQSDLGRIATSVDEINRFLRDYFSRVPRQPSGT